MNALGYALDVFNLIVYKKYLPTSIQLSGDRLFDDTIVPLVTNVLTGTRLSGTDMIIDISLNPQWPY